MNFNRRFLFFFQLMTSLALIFTQLYSGYNLKTLWNDGASWTYNFINLRSFYDDGLFARYIVYIPQLLAVAWMKFVPPQPSVAFEVYSVSFFYILMPYLTLLGIGLYLRRKGHLEFLLFPIIYFVFLHSHAQHFAVNVASDGSMVLWILVFLFWFESGWRLCLASLPWLIFLTFGYELAPVYFGCLVGILAWRWWICRSVSKVTFISSALILIPYSFWYYYQFVYLLKFGHSANTTNVFWQNFFTWPQGMGLLACFAIIYLAAIVITRQRYEKYLYTLFVISGVFCGYQFLNLPPTKAFSASYESRTKIYFLNAILVFLWLLFQHRKLVYQKLQPLIAVGLTLAVIENVMINRYWDSGTSMLKAHMNQKPSCTILSETDFSQNTGRMGIVDWTLPHLSVLLQMQRQPEALVFRISPNAKPGPLKSPCDHPGGEILISMGHWIYGFNTRLTGGFSFPFIKPKNGSTVAFRYQNVSQLEGYIWDSTLVETHMLNLRPGKTYRLELRLSGNQVQGEYPKLRVKIGNMGAHVFSLKKPSDVFNVNFTPTDYASFKMELLFLNDFLSYDGTQDRNLRIDGIIIYNGSGKMGALDAP